MLMRLFFILLLLNPLLFATEGSLDTTFGNAGKVTTDFYGSSDYAYSVSIQHDGKIIVVGDSYNGSNPDFALARYNSNGSLDTTFGNYGKVMTGFGRATDYASSVVIQNDGKIIAVGGGYNNGNSSDFALARYNSDGSLDTTFGNSGKVMTDFYGSSDGAISVSIQNDGKIIAVGEGDNNGSKSDFALARYSSDGSLDRTFGNSGKVMTDFDGSSDGAYSVSIQNDRKIIVVGKSHNGSNSDFSLARYNSDGSLDTTFGNSGKVMTDFDGSTDGANSVSIQNDGKIIVAGKSNNGSKSDFALARYNSDGSLDTTFGNSGKVTTDLGNDKYLVFRVAIGNDGKIVIVRHSGDDSESDFALARCNSDGTLDTTFGKGGKVMTDLDRDYDIVYSVVVQNNGKIIAVGMSMLGGNSDFALVRYNSDGSLDTTFGKSDYDEAISVYGTDNINN